MTWRKLSAMLIPPRLYQVVVSVPRPSQQINPRSSREWSWDMVESYIQSGFFRIASPCWLLHAVPETCGRVRVVCRLGGSLPLLDSPSLGTWCVPCSSPSKSSWIMNRHCSAAAKAPASTRASSLAVSILRGAGIVFARTEQLKEYLLIQVVTRGELEKRPSSEGYKKNAIGSYNLHSFSRFPRFNVTFSADGTHFTTMQRLPPRILSFFTCYYLLRDSMKHLLHPIGLFY